MRPAENIERLIKNLTDRTSAQMDERVLGDVLRALEKSEQPSALTWPKIRRTIMKSRITKLAAAAVVITVVALGLFEFIGTGSKSGVVWAEVAQKVQASRGVIYRGRDTEMDSQEDYVMSYLSSTHSRFDFYKGDQIIKTCHDDYATKTSVYIFHDHKRYIKRTVEGMELDDLWGNPISMVQRFLSHEHRQLEPKTVEGVLCEGIETTDSAFLGADSQADSFMARVWVSVETGYPVKLEGEIVINNGQVRHAFVADQFQWDIELDENMLEPNIPADYMRLPMP